MRFLLALLLVAHALAFGPSRVRVARQGLQMMQGKRETGSATHPCSSSLSPLVTAPPLLRVVSHAKSAAALLAGAVLTLGNPTLTLAANYGGFGSTYAGVINPKDSVLSETGMSEDAKAGLASVKTFIGTIQSAKADLAKDNNIELSQRLQSALNPAVVRGALNKYNTAFSEDTQRGTDRLIRLVLQDLTELDRESIVKAGKTRSEVKVNNCLKRLNAAEESLTQLASFAK